MKVMNRDENRYERESIKDRIKELSSLSFLTVIIAVISIFLMNMIVFPLSYFAVNNVTAFNIILKNISLLMILSAILLILYGKYKSLRRMGMEYTSILFYFLKRPVHYITMTLFTIILFSLLIVIIYYLFSANYYLIYKLAGGVQ
jgi:hypothetical protein